MTRFPLCLSLALAACAPHAVPGSGTDASFAGVQARGATVMGVDQVASEHVFEDLPDGGRILYRMADTADAQGTATIRAHLRQVTAQFAAGDFSAPSEVHAMTVPGTTVLAERRALVHYEMQDRPGGGEVRITTTDPEALAAVHQFLAFQRSDHRAPGSEGGMDHEGHMPGMHHPGTR